ncbi:MAG: Rrf2 family transcriptional regulator [Clostridia bacterium]|nr:Rrf2 family transcriptional regulator [Clostridia bacterium]
MKFTTKSEYGLKATMDLAENFGRGPRTIRSIAENQGIPENYLEQLLSTLRRAGLVKSIRGAQGGYMLAGSPKEITIGEIIRTLEGSVAPKNCVDDENPEVCERAESCVTRMVWERLKDSINEVLDSITLYDLCEEAKKMCSANSFMYYI